MNSRPKESLPFISCLCPTYRRPELLANALACYLVQDYPANLRELIILDDAGQFQCRTAATWRLISTDQRFQSLPEKYNALSKLACGEILIVWEDDDIYLPWHITAHVATLKSPCVFSKPSSVYCDAEGMFRIEDAAGRFHGGLAFTRAAIDRIQGWPQTKRADFDQQLIAKLTQLGPIGDTLQASSPSYIYRGKITHAYHGEDFMLDSNDEAWYQRAEIPGTFDYKLGLEPQFDSHTRECFRRLGLALPAISRPSQNLR